MYWDASTALTLSSEVCDWGEGATDNVGGDIAGGVTYDAGEDASFSCVAGDACR